MYLLMHYLIETTTFTSDGIAFFDQLCLYIQYDVIDLSIETTDPHRTDESEVCSDQNCYRYVN